MSSAQVTKLVNAVEKKVDSMLKNKKGGKGNKGGRGKQRGQVARPNLSSYVLNGHYRMLVDPCFATLGESAYRGNSGNVARFTNVRTISTTTDSAFFLAYAPASAMVSQNILAAAATAFVPTWNTPGPGNGFFYSTASAWRCIGFCVEVDYLGSELARSGLLGSGTVAPNALGIGASQTTATFAPLFPNVARTADRTMEVKWFPGIGNERYASNTDDVATLYENDTTTLVIYGTNMPAGVQLRFTETAIYEWLPQSNLGMSYPSATQGTCPPAAFENLKNEAAKDGSFAHSLKEAAYQGLKSRAGFYAQNAGTMATDAVVGLTAGYLGSRARSGNRRIGW